MEWYLKVMRNYATFTGRARRKEYFMFVLSHWIICLGLGFVTALFKAPIWIPLLYNLGVLVPSCAVAVRRIHDSGHNGWWMLCPFYNIYLLFVDGNSDKNTYGPDPKAPKMKPMSVMAKKPSAPAPNKAA